MSGVCERCGLTLAEHFGVAGEFCPRCEDKPTAEPDAVENVLPFSDWLLMHGKNCAYRWVASHSKDAQRYGDYRHAAGRAEALKPLRDIYSRGRLTFRTDGNPDSVEAQEQEFHAAIRAGDGK